MKSFERIKGKLRPLLERFSDDNLDAIEDACLEFLQNTSPTNPASTRRNTGIHLLLKLASQICELWDVEQPMKSDLLEAISAGAWEPFKRFADVVFTDSDSDKLLAEFQETLRSVLILT